MATEIDSASPKKPPMISLRFIVIVGALAFAAYYWGEAVMTQVMYWQGPAPVQAKQGGVVEVDGSMDEDAGNDNAEGGGGGRGGGGGGFDPAAFFAERDSDGNGKLEGQEISERMQGRMEQVDTDADGAISQEEFVAGMQGGPGGRGGREEGAGGGGGGRSSRPPSDVADPVPADPAAADPVPVDPPAAPASEEKSSADQPK